MSSAQPRELKSLAAGIERDRAAVAAALAYEWSNGTTEGHINRLKTLKRAMYGRAKVIPKFCPSKADFPRFLRDSVRLNFD
jgi:transposase